VRQPEVEENASVVRPRLDAGQQLDEVDVVALDHDLLARGRLDPARGRITQLADLAQRVLEPADALRQLRLDQLTDAVADLVQAFDAEGAGHPAFGAERVHQQRQPAAGRAFEQQRRALLAQHPLHDPGDLEVRVDGHSDAGQVPVALERGHEVLKVGECHAIQYPDTWNSGCSRVSLRSKGAHR